MQKYNYTIQYKYSKEMVLAKHLNHFSSHKESLPIPIHQNTQHVQLSTDKLDAIWGTIKCGPVYNTLYCITLSGWHDYLKQVPRIAQHFWGTWDELSVEAGILLKGNCVYVPQELLNCTLPDLHRAHQGMEKMQAQATEAVYWPGIDNSTTDYIQRCTICTKHNASLPAQPMLTRDIPDSLWQEITANYFQHKRQSVPAHLQFI